MQRFLNVAGHQNTKRANFSKNGLYIPKERQGISYSQTSTIYFNVT